jgi:hypothetical protein
MISRRRFLAWAATTIPAAAIVRRADAAAVFELQRGPATLRALGAAILPSELGAAGIDAEVAAFQKWISGYRENVETTHGYGSSRLGSTGPTPATRWMTQLDDLEAKARQAHAKAFSALTVDERRALVRDALANERGTGIPGVRGASHVALALLGHFYESPVATDLCYEAQIGDSTCRPLSTSSRMPLPLRRRATPARLDDGPTLPSSLFPLP